MRALRGLLEKAEKKVLNVVENTKYTFIFFSIIVIFSGILVGIRNTTNILYNPIDGDFQTYNMVRRLLAGQVPFRDFFVYLGFGPLYLASLFTVFSNTFAFNLVVVDAVSIVIFVFMITVISYVISKNFKYSLIFSTVLLAFILSAIMIFPQSINSLAVESLIAERASNLADTLYKLTVHGTSLKLWRCFIMFAAVALFIYFAKNQNSSIRKFISARNFYLKSMICGAAAGSIILWSNDGGVSTYIALSFCYFLWMIASHRFFKVIAGTVIYSLATLLSVFILVNIFTLGNFTEWLKYTLSVSGYQSWYFGFDKNLSFRGIVFNIYIVFYLVMIIYNAVIILKQKSLTKSWANYAILLLLLANLLGGYIYQIGSSSYEMLPMMHRLIDLIILAFCIYKIVGWAAYKIKPKAKSRILLGAYAISLIFVILLSATVLRVRTTQKDAYVGGGINGNIPYNKEDLTKIDGIIGDQSYFSVYASAFESMREEFQPTRFDYIIHVLGDDYRTEYLNNFKDNNYQYALTIDKNYDSWGAWIQNANWYLYREIFSNYIPEDTIGYNIVWHHTDETQSLDLDVDIKINQTQADTVEIYLSADSDQDLIADVRLVYETSTDNRISSIHHSMVRVDLDNVAQDTEDADHYNVLNVPKESDEYFIPVYIRDGKGYAKLSYVPEGYGELSVKSVTVENIFTDSVNLSDDNQ